MKIRGKFFAQEHLAACVVDGTHTIKTGTELMNETLTRGMNLKNLSLLYYSPFGGDLRPVAYVSFILRQNTSRYSLCSEV